MSLLLSQNHTSLTLANASILLKEGVLLLQVKTILMAVFLSSRKVDILDIGGFDLTAMISKIPCF